MGRGRQGALRSVQRALGWAHERSRDVGALPKCSCGAPLEFPIDRLGRVDYKRPHCPHGNRCPDRIAMMARVRAVMREIQES